MEWCTCHCHCHHTGPPGGPEPQGVQPRGGGLALGGGLTQSLITYHMMGITLSWWYYMIGGAPHCTDLFFRGDYRGVHVAKGLWGGNTAGAEACDLFPGTPSDIERFSCHIYPCWWNMKNFSFSALWNRCHAVAFLGQTKEKESGVLKWPCVIPWEYCPVLTC